MIDSSNVQRARDLLAPVERKPGGPLAALGAAALAATAAMLMAGVVVVGPGVTFEDSRPADVR